MVTSETLRKMELEVETEERTTFSWTIGESHAEHPCFLSQHIVSILISALNCLLIF
jgi:hypothetical protein